MSDPNYYFMLADCPWAGPTPELVKGPDVKTQRGLSIGPLSEVFEVSLEVDAKAQKPEEFPPVDLHGSGSVMLFSERLVSLLDSLGVENIEYFDARVTYAPTGKECAYKVANIVGRVAGLDLSASKYEADDDGFIYSYQKMVFDEALLSGQKIVRLKERVTLPVVHADVKRAVEEQGLTGFMFVQDKDWQPGMI